VTPPVTDDQRQEVVAAAEAVLAAMVRYVRALEAVAPELPDGDKVVEPARTWRDLFAAQVDTWATFRDRHRG